VEVDLEELTMDTHHHHNHATSKKLLDGLMIYRGEHYCQHNEQFVQNF
jgi:hypothetical protein